VLRKIGLGLAKIILDEFKVTRYISGKY